MSKRFLPIGMIAVLAVPLLGSGRATPDRATSFGVRVASSCSLSLHSTGIFDFADITTEGSSKPLATQNNPETTDCLANSATLNVYDTAPSNSTTYKLARLTAGAPLIAFNVCQLANGTNCYTNSSLTAYGIPVSTGGTETLNIYGYLPTQGVTPAGSYRDTITVALTYS